MDELRMPGSLADIMIRDYVCSNCWGSLVALPQPGSRDMIVVCRRCGDQTRGFVTKYFVNERRQQDHFDGLEVKRLLQSLGIISSPPKKSVDQILEELGF